MEQSEASGGRVVGRRQMKSIGRAAGISLGIALALSGCTVGPDFHRPSAPAADSYVVPASGLPAQEFAIGGAIQRDWYRIFDSAATNALIQQALDGSPRLAQARARVAQASAQVRAQRASLMPQVSASLGASRNEGNGAQLGLGGPELRSSFGLYSTGLDASYDLDLAGANRRSVESATAKLDVAKAQYQAAYISLEANVVSSAIEAGALNDKIAATQAILDADVHRLTIFEAQVQAGSIAGSALLQLRSQIASTCATLPPLQQQFAVTRSTVATLVGVPVGEFQMPPLSLRDFHLPSALPVSLPSELVRQRPDILVAEANLHDSTAQLGVAIANLYPSVTLRASYGTATNIASDVFEPGSVIWSLGAGITQPIFDGGRLRAERDGARAALDASAADYRNTVLSAFAEVSNTLQALQNDAAAISDQDEALATAHDTTHVVDAQVRHGSTGYLDLLISNTQFQQANVADIEARSQQMLDIVSLYRSLGGGWWSSAPEPAAIAQQAEPTRAR